MESRDAGKPLKVPTVEGQEKVKKLKQFPNLICRREYIHPKTVFSAGPGCYRPELDEVLGSDAKGFVTPPELGKGAIRQFVMRVGRMRT